MRDPHEPDLFDMPDGEHQPSTAPHSSAAPSAAPAPIRLSSPNPAIADALLILPFPLAARTAKIRDVAGKLVATKTSRHAESYRAQVTEALGVHLRSKRVPIDRHAGQINSFWHAVDLEAARIVHGTRRQGPA